METKQFYNEKTSNCDLDIKSIMEKTQDEIESSFMYFRGTETKEGLEVAQFLTGDKEIMKRVFKKCYYRKDSRFLKEVFMGIVFEDIMNTPESMMAFLMMIRLAMNNDELFREAFEFTLNEKKVHDKFKKIVEDED